MKYLFIISIFLISCSTNNVNKINYEHIQGEWSLDSVEYEPIMIFKESKEINIGDKFIFDLDSNFYVVDSDTSSIHKWESTYFVRDSGIFIQTNDLIRSFHIYSLDSNSMTLRGNFTTSYFAYFKKNK